MSPASFDQLFLDQYERLTGRCDGGQVRAQLILMVESICLDPW